MKKLAIITGTSRGLGLELAQQFLAAGFVVVGVARNNTIKHPQFLFLKMDLSKVKQVQVKLSSFLKKKKVSLKNHEVVLVNNAATILPINFPHRLKEKDVHEAYWLNLQSPILLSQFVIENFLSKSAYLTICNVSSGAAVHPLVNWSVYCSLKSALKMFTDCINLDYESDKKLKAFSFYPGIMDTQMQATIRQQKDKNFKNVQKFRSLKEGNQLLDPQFVAKKLFEILNQPATINQAEYDVQNMKESAQ